MTLEENKLDNPVWHSLNETHKDFSLQYDGVIFYKPEYCLFGGFTKIKNTSKGIDKYTDHTNNLYIVGEEPQFKSNLSLSKKLVCNQMIIKQPIAVDINEQIIELKFDDQKEELFNLINLIQPGYFKSKTYHLGEYFGIYKNNELVAVTGERMKMNKFTEISAVVTHPEYTRRSYAKQLIKHTTDKIFYENKTPYLHVTESNIGAIKLYEKLGFANRRKIIFWNLTRTMH